MHDLCHFYPNSELFLDKTLFFLEELILHSSNEKTLSISRFIALHADLNIKDIGRMDQNQGVKYGLKKI